jgi:hypothetical protein
MEGCLKGIPVLVHCGKGEHMLQTGSAMVGHVSTEKPLSLAWIQDPPEHPGSGQCGAGCYSTLCSPG